MFVRIEDENKPRTFELDTSFSTTSTKGSEPARSMTMDNDCTKRTTLDKNGTKRISHFRRLWHDWADGTTLHGIKFIFVEDAAIRRIYWAIVFLLFVAYLCYLAIIQSQRFYEYKTVTQTSIIMEDNLLFPAVTICNFNLIKKDSLKDPYAQILLKVMYLDEQWEEQRARLHLQSMNKYYLETVSVKSLFLNGSPSLQKSIIKCIWAQVEMPCEYVMKLKPTEYGFCYTFDGTDKNLTFNARTTGSKAGVQFMLWANQSNYYIADEDSAGFKIIIHDRKEEPDLSQSLLVGPGNSYHIGLNKEEKIFLPHPVHAFGTRKCTDLNDVNFKNPLEFFDDYSLYACMRECRSKFTYQHCNCSGPFDAGNYTECRPLEILSCVKVATHIFNTEYDVDNCKCPLPCHVTKYHTKMSSAYVPFNNWWTLRYGHKMSGQELEDNRKLWREQWLQVKIYFESLETVRHEQILRYTQEDLIASFGGFLGLFVGASLITLLEILELVVISVYRLIRNR